MGALRHRSRAPRSAFPIPAGVDRSASEEGSLTRREFLQDGLAGAGAVALGSRGLPRMTVAAPPVSPIADQFDAEVPTAWFDLSLLLVQQTAGFTPPVASRAFACRSRPVRSARAGDARPSFPGRPDQRALGDATGREEPRLSLARRGEQLAGCHPAEPVPHRPSTEPGRHRQHGSAVRCPISPRPSTGRVPPIRRPWAADRSRGLRMVEKRRRA
jgi:hypothetical protein